MNLAHRWLCRSAYWRKAVETYILPWVLEVRAGFQRVDWAAFLAGVNSRHENGFTFLANSGDPLSQFQCNLTFVARDHNINFISRRACPFGPIHRLDIRDQYDSRGDAVLVECGDENFHIFAARTLCLAKTSYARRMND